MARAKIALLTAQALGNDDIAKLAVGVARSSYPSDLTEAPWQIVEPVLPPAKPGGRPRTVDLREAIDPIFYLTRSGCSWRMLPHEFPPWGTIHYYARRWRRERMGRDDDQLREKVRTQAGREPTPNAAIVDGQTVKTTGERGLRGYDAAEKASGRKRHLVADALGSVLAAVVHAADIQDRDGAKLVLTKLEGRFLRLQLIWADAGYRGQLVE